MATASNAALTPPPSHPTDQSSHSNPHEAFIRHLTWTATVSFSTSTIRATASYSVEILSSSAKSVQFDTSHITLHSVCLNGQTTPYTLSPLDLNKAHLGQCLSVSLPDSLPVNANVTVDIEYETTDECSAVQWLPPAQTAGKTYPYLFTQCQAIHARSLLPCMDRPGVKMTYKASVTVPSWATCVMSALSKGSSSSSSSDDTTKTFDFEQPVPIPSYLFALAVGQIESIDISPRCRVWSEPSVVKAAAEEFAQTEDFLKVAESLTLPYQWGRYDLLCLPPSFPYGGMENPCLTFVTPTLLAGDRSLADVVAHEIAHSWTGNLVTNATWEHFWLNEGWTTWLQRKIMARIKNDPKFFDFDAIGGWIGLKETMQLMPDDFTRLVPILGDRDPDDCFSSVPYEKGFNLLYALERRVGSPAFEAFAKAYLKHFKFLTVTSDQFRDFFVAHFEKNAAIQDFDWDTWLHKPGMPPDTPNFDRTLSAASEKLAEDWIAYDATGGTGSSAPSVDIGGWSSNQVTCFLDAILSTCDERDRPMSSVTVGAMKEKYGMDRSKNSEILFRFCMIAVGAGDKDILPIVVHFVTTQGRMKFVRPLYRAMFASEMSKTLAVDTFLSHKEFYHPICAKMIAVDLRVSDSPDTNEEIASTTIPTWSSRQWLLVGLCVATLGTVAVSLSRRRR